MEITDCRLVFETEGKKTDATGFMNRFYSVGIDTEEKGGSTVYEAILTSYCRMKPVRFEIVFKTDLAGLSYFANGYQSWSESPFVDRDYRKRKLSPVASELFRLKYYGDYHFTGKGGRWMHSHMFIDLMKDGSTVLFLGDTMLRESFSWFSPDYDNDTVTMYSDLEGLALSKGDVLKVASVAGCKSGMEYMKLLVPEPERPEKITGWTSWYNYYTDISSDILGRNMDSLERSRIPIDVFQVDDGYFTSVGDWLSPNERFPRGMGNVAREIRKRGWIPGIWIAPFVCERDSDIFRGKSHWIARDGRNRLLPAGWNPNWSGIFYAMDIDNREYREYLAEVFKTMKDEYGYGFFKLDFLYAACIAPKEGRTRAMAMAKAMDFLREMTKGALFLACGVPIASAVGTCDYCRIGADISHGFEDRFLRALGYRERVSTFSAMNNIKSRSFLDGYAFGNDPDVFILRDSDEIKLSSGEKELLFRTNMENSSLVFFSDDVGGYSDKTAMKVRREFVSYRQSGV